MNVTDPLSLTAIFLPTQLLPGSVVVNEINYHSNDDFDSGDWIELYNPGQLYLDMSGWTFKDDNDNTSQFVPIICSFLRTLGGVPSLTKSLQILFSEL